MTKEVCEEINKKKVKKYRKLFFDKAPIIHNNFYIYDKFVYQGDKKKGIITCPIHGDFLQTPYHHLRGSGCKQCGIEKMKESKRQRYLDKHNDIEKEFVKNATIRHNGFYLYDKFVYVDSKTDGIITCPIHGDFLQTPNRHLSQGSGCPKCKVKNSRLENDLRDFLKREYNGIIIEQYKVDWLGALSLDFYLPSYNVAIECQGKQHFEPINFFGGEKVLKEIQERDNRKKRLCEEHNVKILYYSDLDIDYPYPVFINKEELLREILS